MTKLLRPASRSPWACWGCISGIIFFLVLVISGGYFWLLRYYEHEAYEHLSAKERVEFQAWLQEPIEYPHEMLVARPAKPDNLASQEKRNWAKLGLAYKQVRQLSKATSATQIERATSITMLLGPPLAALTHLANSKDFVSNDRLPIGSQGLSIDQLDNFVAALSYYVTSLIKLEEHLRAADSLASAGKLLEHDPECEIANYCANDVLRIQQRAVESTSNSSALRRIYAALIESSGTLTDVHSAASFLPDDYKHLPRLMLEHGYIKVLPKSRQDWLRYEVEADKFYWYLRRTLPQGNMLKQYLDNGRKGSMRYHFDYRIPPPLMRLQIGPLKSAFKNLAIAHKVQDYVHRFKNDRYSKAMEPNLIKGYNDLATSITIRLAEIEDGG